MKINRQKIKVLSLGGSLINPGKIDVNFIQKFKNLILEFVRKGYKFLIVCGGGKIARDYQKALKEFKAGSGELDTIGIHATYINARLLQIVFGKNCGKNILSRLPKKIELKKPILIASGTKPGFSTDYDAFYFAKVLGVKEVINLTNINYVYSEKKGQKFIRPVKTLSWKSYLEILKKQAQTKWQPGINLPLDPLAARFALKNGINAIILNGKKFENLKKAIIGYKTIKGTIIYSSGF